MTNNLNRHPATRRAFAGFTLVETMVALLIGLLATFIIMQVFAVSEGEKRTIMGGADAQSDAAVVLYLIERDLRQAGYGLSPNPDDFTPAYTAPILGGALTNGILAQCTQVNAYKSDRATGTPAFQYLLNTFAPVVINPAGYPAADTGTDIVLVNYGASNGMIGKGLVLTAETATTQTGGDVPDFVVKSDKGSTAGLMNGDLVLAVPPAASGNPCAIAEITGLPDGGAPGCTDFNPPPTIIRHNSVAYPSFYTGCTSVTATWNQAGVDLLAGVGSKLYNLGRAGLFVSRVYAVRNGNLTVCDITMNDCTADPPVPAVWTPIAGGVVGLQAQYGQDPNLDGVINTWDKLTPVTVPPGVARAQVAAVRLAVVVRSGQFEREVVTTASPRWNLDATGTSNIDFDLTAQTDWNRYRYKTAQSIVPVRNLIWGQQN